MSWLVWLHVLYACSLVVACRAWRDWKPSEQLHRVARKDEVEAEAASLFPTPSRAPRTPFVHAHHPLGLVLHLLCVVAATYACLRVEDAAGVELRASGLLQSASTTSSAAAAAAAASELHHPHDAEDLIPIQRGGWRTVQQIMEQDVAHLTGASSQPQARTPPPSRQQQRPRHSSNNAPTGPVAPLFAKDAVASTTSTAAPALLLHVLSLPICLAHVLLYSPWSWIDPRRASPAPRSHFLRPHFRALFQATAGTGYLMLLTLAVALYCLLSTDLDSGTSTFDSVHASGLLTGLLYLPFFLLHVLRFALNAIFLWRWKLLFPQVAATAAQAAKIRDRFQAKRGIKMPTLTDAASQLARQGEAEEAATAASSSSSSSTAAPRQRHRQARASAPVPAVAAPAEDSSSGSDGEGEEEDAVSGEEFDLGLLQELASFAPADSPLDPSVDPLAPSALMQRLRATSKLQQLAKEEAARKRREKKEGREKEK